MFLFRREVATDIGSAIYARRGKLAPRIATFVEKSSLYISPFCHRYTENMHAHRRRAVESKDALLRVSTFRDS